MRELGLELTALSLNCFTDGQESLERVVTDRLTVLTQEVGGMIRSWTLNSALTHLRVFLSSLSVDEETIRALVISTEQGRQRRSQRQERLTAGSQIGASDSGSQTVAAPPPAAREPEDMEVTEAEAPAVLAEIPPPGQESPFPSSLLSVPALSSPSTATPDLGPLPSSWLPIITR